MTINADMIVDVTARAVRAGSTALEFNGLLITGSNKALPFQRFESAEAVQNWFGADSLEAKFATAYFSADVMKTRAPRAVCYARDGKETSSGWIRSGALPSLETIKKISNGSFNISIAGESVAVTSLDLHSVTSLAEAATTIAQKITGTKGEYDPNGNCFWFTTTAKGAKQTVGFASGEDDASKTLALTEETGAIVSSGTDVMTVDELMKVITDISRNWVTFTNTKEQETERAVEFAKWVSKQDIAYIYLPFTEQPTAYTVSTADLASALEKAGVSYTAPIFGDLEYASFFAGMIASTDWSATNGVKNYAFKQSSFLPANVTKRDQAEILKSKKYNFIGNFASRNAEFQISAWGTILGKTFHYIDEVAGMIWLANETQRVLMDGLVAVNRVPYNPSGYNMIRTWMHDPIDAGLNNGFIQSGVLLSATQKTQLTEAVGIDVSKEVETKGYYLKVSAPTAEIRSNRGSPIVQLYFTYGGAVLKIDPTITAYL